MIEVLDQSTCKGSDECMFMHNVYKDEQETTRKLTPYLLWTWIGRFGNSSRMAPTSRLAALGFNSPAISFIGKQAQDVSVLEIHEISYNTTLHTNL